MSRPLALAPALLLVGCGGGQALLHPAHAVAPQAITVGAGVGGHVVVGKLDEAIDAARRAAQQGGSGEPTPIARGSLAQASVAPGVSPWVGARVGLGDGNDAGLTYSGRSVRLDARHAFEWGAYAVSAGAGASTLLFNPGSSDPDRTTSSGGIRGVDTGRMRGWALDAPVLFGWRSDADIVRLWTGARAGFERAQGDLILPAPSEDPDVVAVGHAELDRWYVGGLVGLAVGVGPIWGALELTASYQRLDGSLELGSDRLDARLGGLSLSPAAALLTQF